MAVRDDARLLAEDYLRQDKPTGWFEPLYALAGQDPSKIPWADLAPNPNLIAWLNANKIAGKSRSALVVGCGLGDDAEELARRGFGVTAFDISPTAIDWCKRRFPETHVAYIAADLLDPPLGRRNQFDFILESYTLQALPPDPRPRAMEQLSNVLAQNGELLIIARGRDESDPAGSLPWPLTKKDLSQFERCGLRQISFEDFLDSEDPPVRRFRVLYKKDSQP